MIAAKHFDPVMGMDIHINLIPTPGGPVPTPLPHIYAGMVFDPFDFVPVIGQTISVNGKLLLAAQPMTECKFFGQVPMAGPFAKPPEMVGEIMLGSMTVGTQSMALADMPSALLSMPAAIASIPGEFGKSPLGAWVGDVMGSSDNEPAPEPPPPDNAEPEAPANPDAPPPPEPPPPPPPTSVYPLSRLGDMILGCADVGAPAPTSGDKKGGIKGFTFPGGVVMAIPMGAPVLIGGGPAPAPLSAFAMKFLMKFGMAALSKALGGALRKFNDLLQTKFGDNPVSNKLCDWGFEPVDIASGKVMTSREDFALPGPIPLVWECIYYSNTRYIDGPLGARWSHSYDMYLEPDIVEEIPVIKLRMSDGRLGLFPQLEIGESYYNRQERLELFRDENGFLLRDADRLYYRFEEAGKRWQLIHIKDTSDNTILFDYDEQGALKKITDSVGRELQVDTDAYNRILAIHAPHPTTKNKTFPIVRYEYDKEGDLIAAYNAHDNAFRYKYHKHLMTQLTYRDGLSFYYKYDSEEHTARCIHTYGDGDLYKGNLHYEEGKTTIERIVGHPDGHIDTYTEIYYHDGAVVHRKIDALGNETKYEYNDFYELQAEIDPLGNKTTYQYDDRGNLTQTTYPDKTKIQMTYSAEGLLEQATDQVGGKWKWEYDDKGRLIRRTDCMDRATEYKYDDKGLLTQFTDPMGGRTLIGYNKNKEPDQVTLPNNASTRWEYDRLGRSKATTDPKGNVQRRTFDLLGQVTKVQEPDGNILKLKYDAEGNIIHAKDKQRDIAFEYMGLGELKTRTENKTKVEFRYNTDEQLVGVVNEHGYVYKFDVNANGEVKLESGFDGIKRRYHRDAAGRVTKVSRPAGIESFYKYDPLGRITERLHSNGEIEQYFYREDGELMRAVNEAADVVFEKDLIGNTITEIQNGYQVHSEYNEMGLRTHLSTSLGLDLEISRDIMGDVSGMKTGGKTPPWEIKLKRDIMGLELERLLPGGVKGKWERDRLGRPIKHHVFGGDGKTQRSRAYEWDVNDRLKRFIDFGKDVTQFQHDKVGNLASAIYPDGSSQYRTPDAVGNLFCKADKSDRKYGPAGQLLEAESTRYDYDAEGNLIKKTTAEAEVWHYKWNASGMLEKVIRPDKKEVTFAYDALGRRTAKTYDGSTTRWIWDANVPIHQWQTLTTDAPKNTTFTRAADTAPAIPDDDDDEIIFIEKGPMTYGSDEDTDVITIQEVTTASKTVETAPQTAALQMPVPVDMVTWLFEPDSFAPIAKLTKDKQYSVQTDHLGTPISMYDDEGKRTWACELDIYGNIKVSQGDIKDCPFRYPGQYEDMETGLYYNRFRYYDGISGGYISQDMIGLLGNNPTLYGYVSDVNVWGDLLGLQKCKLGDPKKMKELGLEGVNLRGKSFNSGRKILESKGFKFKGKTKTVRMKFEHPKTGTKVSYDGTSGSLAGKQDPHWHIQGVGGEKYGGTGLPASQDKFGGHIPSNKGNSQF